MERTHLTTIIEAGNMAPSGGNSQAWRFVAAGDRIEVIPLPERDHPVMNYRNRGTYVGLGAVLTNMKVAAAHLGYDTSVSMSGTDVLRATCTFTPRTGTGDASLFEAIAARHSNRKPYETTPLTDIQRKNIFSDTTSFPSCTLALIEGDAMQPLGLSLATDILINLTNKRLHALLFKEVLWHEHEQETHPGLYVKTMEATGGKAFAMKLLSRWPLARIFTKLGVPLKIREESAKTATSAAAIGIVSVPNDDRAFVDAGSLLQEIWLRATAQGLHMQLMAGTAFLWQQAVQGKDASFSDTERALLDNALTALKAAASTPADNVVAYAFRIGSAPPPLAVSFKRPAVVEWN